MNTLRYVTGILMLLALTVPGTAMAAIDTTPPITSATLAGTKGNDGWYTTSVTVTLAATDGADGSGVAQTEYSLDNLTWQTYSAPFTLDKDGDQYVYFRSTDLAGNIESPVNSQQVKINRSGLVAWWKMDGDWKDASLGGNNGTPVNGATFSPNAKIGTHAGSFDGINDYILIPNSPSLNPSNITVELWAKSNIATWNSFGSMASKRDAYILHPMAGSKEIRFYAFINGSWQRASYNNPNLDITQWHHYVGTFDGISLNVYVDGIKSTLQSPGFINTADAGALYIGRDDDRSDFFNGLLDGVSIYNRALSDIEIQEHYRTYAVKSPTVNPVPSSTATSTITLSGTKPANTAIAVNGNTLVPLDGSTSWQANYTLSAGVNNLAFTATSNDLVSLPTTLTVLLDATPPQVSATTPMNNVILKAAPGVLTFTLADDFSPLNITSTVNGATVKNASGANVAGTWSSSWSGTTGSVTFTPSAALIDGAYSATIKPTDALGNASSYTLAFTVDRTPPVAPVFDPVNATINTTGKTITGSKSSDSTVIVSCAGATIGSTFYPTATTWVVNVSGLKEGSNTVSAYSVDPAGNQSGLSFATITVDTMPPVVGATPAGGIYSSPQSVTLTANELSVIYYTTDGSTPTAGATVYTRPIAITASTTLTFFGKDLAGNNSEIKSERYVIDMTPPIMTISTLSDGAYTNNEVLNIAGTVTDNTEVKGITINGTTVPINADGSFSYALRLRSGINVVAVAATDSAGNTATDTRNVTLDQAAPVLGVASPADNSKTGKAVLEVSGTVDKTSAVTVKVKEAAQSALMDGETFNATVILEPGYNTVEIVATDLAGNQASLKRTVVFDDQVPSLAVIVPNQDIRTNQRSVTIRGTVHDALTSVGVKIIKDNEILTPQVVDGAFEQVLEFSEEKSYPIVVTASNEVGASATAQRNVIYDITPPTLGIDQVTSPTSQTSQMVTGTREAGTAVTVTSSTANVGEVSYPTPTTWQADIFGLTEGENVINAQSADAAGNAVTATAIIAVSTKPLQINIKASPELIWPPDHKMVPVTVSGGVEANGSDIRSVSIAVTDEYGKYEYKNVNFGSTVMLEAWREGSDQDGRKYTITVVVTDKGGKATAKTATVIVPHDVPKPKKAL